MLTMRDDQLTLGIADEQGFIDWFVKDFMPDHLTEYHEKFDEETLCKRVKHGRTTAIRYGFKDPTSQVQFIALMWRFGPHFYRYPGFWKITQEMDKPGPDRIDRYYKLSDDEFADVVIGNHDSDWFTEPDSIPEEKLNIPEKDKE